MSTRFRTAFLTVVILLLHGIGNPHFSSAGSWPATDGYPYYGQTVPFHWIEISTVGTAVTLGNGDLGYAGPLNIGFTFPFYNTTPNSFYVSADGYISFDPNNQEPLNQCPLPDSDAPNNVIALMWGDLLTNNPNHSIFYKYYSSCPVGSGECLVVEYVGFNFYFSGEKAGTFEAILYKTGDIILQFLDVGPNAGKDTTTGIENSNAGLNHGLTFACNSANSLANNLAIQFKKRFLAVTPEDLTIRGCNGQTGNSTFTLKNYTGSPGTNFTLSYNVTTGNASLTGPGNVIANPTSAFEVTLTPDPCLPPGTRISGTITAQGNGFTSTAVINQTLYQTDVWDDIPPEPEFCRNDIVAGAYEGKIWSITGKGASDVRTYDPVTRVWSTVPISNPNNLSLDNYARSGCQHGSKVYFYGDTVDANFSGLWAFDMAAKTVSKVTYTGGPNSPKIFGPAWTYDPGAGLCYLTGGADSPTGNSRKQVYVYNPTSNQWSPLPEMENSREALCGLCVSAARG